jgi:hypothetical protein
MTVTSTPVDQDALTVPAPYVNRFQITTVDRTLVRISFAEMLGSDRRNYRAAVMMTVGDAKEIALSILTMVGTASTTPS